MVNRAGIMAKPTQQDSADLAYNQITSKDHGKTQIHYARLRDGKVVKLNPMGPCYGGEIHPMDGKHGPMALNVVAAWFDQDKNLVWERPNTTQPPVTKQGPPPPPSKAKRTPAPPPPPPSKAKQTSAPPPPPPMKTQQPQKKTVGQHYFDGVDENHIIYTKITEGKATADDFNQLIQEATPESVRDRVRRRTTVNDTDSHQDIEGHQQLNLPSFGDRVQPKRKPAGHSQMNGRGRIAHRHSARTQSKTVPERFVEAVEFIKQNIGKPEYNIQLVEDKHALNLLATKMMAIPNINRDWLSDLITILKK